MARSTYSCQHYTPNNNYLAISFCFIMFQDWLERTPGLEKDGFNFFGKFKVAASKWIDSEFYFPAEVRRIVKASMKNLQHVSLPNRNTSQVQ